MKTFLRALTATCICAAASVSVVCGQEALLTGYFTDGYVYGHKLNPALVPAKGYVSFPFLNFTASTGGNLTASALLYPSPDGSLKTFLSHDVKVSDLAGRLKPDNVLNSSLNWTIFSGGWYNRGGWVFTTFDVSLRTDVNVGIPAQVFSFVKNLGMVEGETVTHDLSGLDASVNSWLQLSFGQSYGIADKIHVGYKLKVLFGAACARAEYKRLKASLSNELWHIEADGHLDTSPVFFGTKTGTGGQQVYDFKSFAFDGIQKTASNFISNLGFAGDLGLSWDITDAIQLSMAVHDIGYVNFKNVHSATPSRIVDFGGYTAKTTEDLISYMRDRLSPLIEFVPDEDSGKKKYGFWLPVTARAGLSYRMPFYDKLSFAVLYSQQFLKRYGWWDVRLSANCDVLRWLGLSASFAGGNRGHHLGAFVNLHAGGFNLFFGADNIPLGYASNGIPLYTCTTNATVGITFLVGKYRGRYPKK